MDSNRWSHPHARQNAELALMSTSFALLPRSKLIKGETPLGYAPASGRPMGPGLPAGHRGPVNRSSALEKAFRSGGTVSSNPSSSSGESLANLAFGANSVNVGLSGDFGVAGRTAQGPLAARSRFQPRGPSRARRSLSSSRESLWRGSSSFSQIFSKSHGLSF